jgi:hypothetical protein
MFNMSNILFLLLIFTMITLGVLIISMVGRPVLVLPSRLFPRLSRDAANDISFTVLAALGMGLAMFLALSLGWN